MSHPSCSATAVLPVQRHSCRGCARRTQTMLYKNERTSAGPPIPADLAYPRLSDTISAGQALSDGNASGLGTREWPRRPAPPRHAGRPKGCYHQGVLPQNGARDGQGCAASPCCLEAEAGGGAMVRRAILDRSAQSAAHVAGAEASPGAPDPARSTAERTGPRWRGAGSRWLIWASRAVLWAVLLVIAYRGVTAIVTTPKPAPVSPAAGAGAAHGFPVSLAEAYAMQFGQVYLNFSPAPAAQRASQLAVFLPAGSDAQLGWDGAGSLRLQSEQVAAISVQDSQHAMVTLLVRANGQLMELGVPVYSANGGLAISAEPSLLPPPPHVTPPQTQPAPSDPATSAALSGQLPAFFRAYASGDPVTLGRFLAPGASVTGLGGAVTYGSITGIDVPPGGATRHITISVIWQFPGQAAQPTSRGCAAPGGGELTYRMTVIQQNGSWDVAAIGPSSQTLAPP